MEQQAKFKERLEQALKIRRMKPVELHRLTGISESTKQAVCLLLGLNEK